MSRFECPPRGVFHSTLPASPEDSVPICSRGPPYKVPEAPLNPCKSRLLAFILRSSTFSVRFLQFPLHFYRRAFFICPPVCPAWASNPYCYCAGQSSRYPRAPPPLGTPKMHFCVFCILRNTGSQSRPLRSPPSPLSPITFERGRGGPPGTVTFHGDSSFSFFRARRRAGSSCPRCCPRMTHFFFSVLSKHSSAGPSDAAVLACLYPTPLAAAPLATCLGVWEIQSPHNLFIQVTLHL